MKTPFNFQLSFVFLSMFCCFVFMSAGCDVNEKDLANPDVEIKNPDNNSTPRGQSNVIFIEQFQYYAALEAYTDCAKKNGNCNTEKNELSLIEKVLRGLNPPIPIPLPPSPCAPTGHCPDLEFMRNVINPASQQIQIVVVDAAKNDVLGFNDPSKTVASKEVRGYVNTDFTIKNPNFTGLARVEMKNLRTNEKTSFELTIK